MSRFLAALFVVLGLSAMGAAPAGATGFTVSNGRIISPTGANFQPRGVDMYESLAVSLLATSTAPLTTLFPGINTLYIYNYSYGTPSTYATFINTVTAAGIVVVFGNTQNFFTDGTGAGSYGGGCGDIFTGSILTTESNWYASMATYYANNPYVWFATNNEPSYVTGTTSDNCSSQGGTINLPALATWEQATYNAIRNTGNNAPILLSEPAGGNPGTVGAYANQPGGPMTASVFSTMTNIVWDLHYYGFVSNYSTNQATVNANLIGSGASSGTYQGQGILAAQTLTSANGTVPVFIGEFGVSTNASTLDANGQNVVTAVATEANGSYAVGGTAWNWSSGDCCNNLTTNNNALTSPYGTSVASFIAEPSAVESLGISAIANQSASAPFTVSGTISGVSVAPTLQYQDNGGTWTALPSGATVTTSSFSFTNPGLTAAASATVGVRDANSTSVSATSNTFTVTSPSGGPTGITTAANLLTYLKSLVGNHVLSGQFTENGGAGATGYYNLNPITAIHGTTGQWLGLLGIDAQVGGVYGYDSSPFSGYAQAYWQAGGLLEMNWFSNNPVNGNGLQDFQAPAGGWSDVYTPGTAANNTFTGYLNTLAANLQLYQNAGIPLLFRPFVEMNGDWWWYAPGGCCGTNSTITNAQFIALWQYTWNYLTNTKGLNNLVWIYSVNACGPNAGYACEGAMYPGAAYVDVIGWDVYTDTPGQGSQGDYTYLSSFGKPLIYGEFGAGSPSAGDTSFAETELVSQLQQYAPNVVMFQQWWSGNGTSAGWGMDTLTNTSALSSAINNSYVINRGSIICTTCGGPGPGPGPSGGITWNPGDTSSSISLSNSNLTATGITAIVGGSRSTLAYAGGSYCFEVTANTVTADESIGIANASLVLAGSGTPGGNNYAIAFYPSSGNPQAVFFNGVQLLAAASAADANGDKITECANLNTDLLWVSTPSMRTAAKTWNNSSTANPATGTGGLSFSGLTCPCYINFGTQDVGTAATLNASGPFAVATPAGFSAWQPTTTNAHHPIMFNLGKNDLHTPDADILPFWYRTDVNFRTLH